jgi:hypothetical protein
LWTEPAGLLRAPQNEKAKQDKHEHNYDCVRILLSRATARLYKVVLSKRRGYTCSLCHFASQVGLHHFPTGVGTKLVNQDSGYDGSKTVALPSILFLFTFQNQ